MAKIDNATTAAPAPEKAGAQAPESHTETTPEVSSGSSPAPAPETPPPAVLDGLKEPEPGPARPAFKAAPKPKLPPTERPYLESPRAFGIWIGGVLVRFQKGKTRLTEEQATALETHPYTADNEAEVIR